MPRFFLPINFMWKGSVELLAINGTLYSLPVGAGIKTP